MTAGSKIAILALGTALLFGTGSLRGQTMPIVSQAALDSLAHPAAVSGGEAMRF